MAGFPNPTMGNDAGQDRAAVDKAGQDNLLPGVAAGASIGAGGTVSLAAGSTDVKGSVVINTGTAATAGAMATVTFAKAYDKPPTVQLTGASNGNPCTFCPLAVSVTTGTFTINALAGPTSSVANQAVYYLVTP